MMMQRMGLGAVVVGVLSLGLACMVGGCVQDAGYYEGSSGGYYGGSTSTSTGDAGGISGDGAPSTAPMLAKIDPNGTMKQTPGQGVGVFTQYAPAGDGDPGGHWYVWWTCDTTLSGQSCPYKITLSVKQGDIANVATEGFAQTDALSAKAEGGGGNAITATTTTTDTVQGVRFDTTPGVVLTVSAALEGEYSGSFLFFVQDDKVNGGYTGMLTDPLELQSTSP